MKKRIGDNFDERDLGPYAETHIILGTITWLAVYHLIISNTLSNNLWMLVTGWTMLGVVQYFNIYEKCRD